ncbi:hypothetical protein SJ891_13800, partial [Enterococcus faecium]
THKKVSIQEVQKEIKTSNQTIKKDIGPGVCNPTARSLRDRSFVFSSVGLTHRKRLVELWLLFKIH